jgi:hypothetical protein
MNEWLIFALRNIASNEFFIDFISLLDVCQIYGNIYQNTLLMESPIIHNL